MHALYSSTPISYAPFAKTDAWAPRWRLSRKSKPLVNLVFFGTRYGMAVCPPGNSPNERCWPVLAATALAGLGVAAIVTLSRRFRRRAAAPSRSAGGPDGARAEHCAAMRAATGDGSTIAYAAPPWMPHVFVAPLSRLALAHLPTPLHRWPLPGTDDNVEVWIKRDDCTGCELSGNKVRKLEFLLAAARESGCDSVVTYGGLQSNHCRATAAAARRVGLEPHVVLHVPPNMRPNSHNVDPRMLVGNVLIDRLVGAHVHLVPEADVVAPGAADALLADLALRLTLEQGRSPYVFPSGGSNVVGTWGYVEAVAELLEQLPAPDFFDRIYFACGSGGTGAGLALGVHFSGIGSCGCELVGLCVDSDPDAFHAKIDALFTAMAPDRARVLPPGVRLLRLEDAVGDGYAKATDAELEFLCDVAQGTGVVLDPVYSGKAARGMLADLAAHPLPQRGGPRTKHRVLFIHTGGLLGLYAKVDQLAPLLQARERAFAALYPCNGLLGC